MIAVLRNGGDFSLKTNKFRWRPVMRRTHTELIDVGWTVMWGHVLNSWSGEIKNQKPFWRQQSRFFFARRDLSLEIIFLRKANAIRGINKVNRHD